MEICRLDKVDGFGNGHFIKVSRHEALVIIASLANQLKNDNPTSGRIEMRDKDGAYFSIAVCEDTLCVK